MAAAMSAWLYDPSVSPMSWSRAQTTYSSSSPARKARVAVWREWVNRSTAKPPKSPSSSPRWPRTRSARPCPCSTKLFPMMAQSSAVDSSMPVNVARTLLSIGNSLLDGADLEDGGDVGVVGDVAHDLGHVGAHGGREGVDGVEVEEDGGDVGRGLAPHPTRQAFEDGGALEGVAAALLDQRDVLVDVVV